MSNSYDNMNQNGFTNTKANKRTKGTNSETGSVRELGRFADRPRQLRKSAYGSEIDTGIKGQGNRRILQSSKNILQSSRKGKAHSKGTNRQVKDLYISYFSFYPSKFKPQCGNCGSIAIKHYDDRYICYTCGMEDYSDV